MPNQKVVIPARNNDIIGIRVLEMNFTTSENITDSSSDEWIASEIKAAIPDDFPELSENALFLDVKYPYEEGRGRIDWSDPQNHMGNPHITLGIPKPGESYTGDVTEQGCAIYRQVLIYENSTNTWNSTNNIIISNDSTSETLCRIVIPFEHFSRNIPWCYYHIWQRCDGLIVYPKFKSLNSCSCVCINYGRYD